MNLGTTPSSCLAEGEALSEVGWLARLGITDSQFRVLVSDGVFRASTGDPPSYRLDLVGLLFTRDRAFAALPKIFRGVEDPSVTREVIACVGVYLRRLKRHLRAAEASETLSAHDDSARSVDWLLALVNWTLDRGFHSEDFESQSLESFDIDWIATMDHGLPLHVGKSIVYSEIIGRRVSYQLGPLAHLQATALLTLHRDLKPASLLWLDEHDPILEQASRIIGDYASNDDSVVATQDQLADYQSICNRDHDRELAGILFDWLADSPRRSERPTVFGTTAFQYVWEDICEVAVRDLGSPVSHKEIASQPGYFIDGYLQETDGQRPDIALDTSDGICILDAKWYDVGNREWPGSQDVIKQMMYESTVDEERRVSGNVFLVPVPERTGEPRIIGEARMVALGRVDGRFPSIDVIGIPWHSAVAVYCGRHENAEIGRAVRSVLRDGRA